MAAAAVQLARQLPLERRPPRAQRVSGANYLPPTPSSNWPPGSAGWLARRDAPAARWRSSSGQWAPAGTSGDQWAPVGPRSSSSGGAAAGDEIDFKINKRPTSWGPAAVLGSGGGPEVGPKKSGKRAGEIRCGEQSSAGRHKGPGGSLLEASRGVRTSQTGRASLERALWPRRQQRTAGSSLSGRLLCGRRGEQGAH